MRDRARRRMMAAMTRRLLVIAVSTLASALPAGVALADDPAPVVTPPPYVVTVPDEPPVATAPPVVVTNPEPTTPGYCNVVIDVDPPTGPDGPIGTGTTIFAPCGSEVSIPTFPIDVPASAAAPVVASRLGYVPEWVAVALGA